MVYLESATTNRAPLEATSLQNTLITQQKEGNNWLIDYEKRFDSIFRYYSVENEVEFLKKSEQLSFEKKDYYIQENVRRFLGEFVGKIPYTTIPYTINESGFSYAGLPIMDSYRNAAQIGGERERAEISGFEQIETEFKKIDGGTSAFWISPPKTADYGFVFVFEKDAAGFVKEYILRYPEQRGILEKSSQLFTNTHPGESSPIKSDDFLRSPAFGNHITGRENIEEIMRIIGIDEHIIQSSRNFENAVDMRLGIWIQKYSQIVYSLSRIESSSPLYHQGLIEAKKILLTIYQGAEEINRDVLHPPQTHRNAFLTQERLSQASLDQRVALIQSNASFLPRALMGSCPAIHGGQNPLENTFISNLDMLSALNRGISPEQIVQKGKKNTLECTCPYCKHKVKAVIANGTITCPRKECGKTAPYAC